MSSASVAGRNLSPASTGDTVQQHGFAVLPNILPEHECCHLIAALGTLRADRSRAGIRHAMGHSFIASVAYDERLIHIARQVLGVKALPFRATLFDKSRQANWLVVWHQDTALPLRERHEVPGWGPWSKKGSVIYAHAPATALRGVLALRLHLDDSSADNGPLRVLPGTHSHGVLTEKAVEELAANVKPIECVAARGGVVAMRPLLIHASSKSRSDVPRRVLHIEYAASSKFDGELELAIA